MPESDAITKTQKLGNVVRIARVSISPRLQPTKTFLHHSLPAFDELGGPVAEKGEFIESNKTLVAEPTVLVSKLNPRISRVSVVQELGNETNCASTEFIPYVVNSEVLDINFFAWFCRSYRFQSELIRTATGSTNSHTRAKPFETLEWNMPDISLNEQRRIALILDTADAAIAKTEALIAKLKQLKAGLLHDLLTRGIDETSGYSFLKGKVLDNPWRVETLAKKLNFITDYRGKTPPRSNHGIPIISAEVVLNGRLKPTVKWVTEEVYKEWTTRGFPEPGDVIFTTEAPVGEVAPVPEHTVLLTRRVIALRPTDDVNKRFLYWFLYWLNSIGFWKPRSRGTTVPRILKPDILSILIPVPSPNEQESIVSTLDSVETRLEREVVVLEKQRLLKAGLMNDLLTGKKPVFADVASAT